MEKKELIEITNKGGLQTVSARELHEKLNVKTEFKDWIKRMIEYGFEDKKDFCSFLSKNTGGRPSKEYFISIDMAKEICMIQRSETGKKFRQYFIECEKKLIHNSEQKMISDSPLEKARFLHEIANEYSDNHTYKQILDAYAVKEVTGEFVLPLPQLQEKNYSATEIGKRFGVSANKIGSIANKLGIKVDGEYGHWYIDKSAYSNKEVNVFRYSEKAIDLIKKELA